MDAELCSSAISMPGSMRANQDRQVIRRCADSSTNVGNAGERSGEKAIGEAGLETAKMGDIPGAISIALKGGLLYPEASGSSIRRDHHGDRDPIRETRRQPLAEGNDIIAHRVHGPTPAFADPIPLPGFPKLRDWAAANSSKQSGRALQRRHVVDVPTPTRTPDVLSKSLCDGTRT